VQQVPVYDVATAGVDGLSRSRGRTSCQKGPLPLPRGSLGNLPLFCIVSLGIALRILVRVFSREEDFWQNSYSAYYDSALSVFTNGALCIDGVGVTCAWWPPVYPLFLASAAAISQSYLAVVVPQAIVGAGTIVCAFLLGQMLFGRTTGLIASCLTSIYPYYVMHDTALQETSLFTFLTAVSMVLLIRWQISGSDRTGAFAGVALALGILTRASLLPFAVLVLIWSGLRRASSFRTRIQRVLLITGPLALLVGCWLITTYLATGSPMLTAQSGVFLWKGNNPETFSHYPAESIDLSTAQAWDSLSAGDLAEIDRLSVNEGEQSAWFLRRGWQFIEAHPTETMLGAVRKLWVAFGWVMSPIREPAVEIVQAVSYLPLASLAVVGAVLSRRKIELVLPIYLLVVSFAFVTAVFWAHTSHRSYLDIYMQVLAAYTLQRAVARLWAASQPVRWWNSAKAHTGSVVA
jgi:4-amino-4-deoxy-L-arabinose transferase-like glycosyltransferase